MTAFPLVAQTLTRTFYDLSRLHSMSQWWHWMALVALCGTMILYVSWLYRRDSIELSRGTRWSLLFLRIAAFAGILMFFLNLEKRTEKLVTKNSRLIMLLDTSESMNLVDSGAADGESRIQQIVHWLKSETPLENFRQKHDVAVYRFDQTNVPTAIATFPKTLAAEESDATELEANLAKDRLRETRVLYAVSIGLLAISLVCFVLHVVFGAKIRGAEGEAYAMLIAAVFLITAIVVSAVGNLRNPSIDPMLAFGLRENNKTPVEIPQTEDQQPDSAQPVDPVVDWEQALEAKGGETRMGEALRHIILQEQGGPISGIVLITDGANNAGVESSAAAKLAQQTEIPIYPVGLGSNTRTKNIRIVDIEAPPRVFPGDQFTIKAFIQANGIENQAIQVSLVSDDESDDTTPEVVEEEIDFQLGEEGEIRSLEFRADPDAVGRRIYSVKLELIEGEIDENDNVASEKIEIVERRNRVLLFAGGPTREYRFLRNLLFRDKNTEMDVHLQTAPSTAAQESNQLLLDFPNSPNALFEYDCIVAFDPDWTQLELEQINLLDRWVAEKAGGLLLVAGPVYMPKWTSARGRDSKLAPIRALYPVTFYGRLSSSIQLGRYAAEDAWPLELSEAAWSADFLRLNDEESDGAALDVWQEFDGVYGYFAVKEAKPGATIYASFSDPATSVNDRLPIYMASQFYGAGRVHYLGSGEMWRLNELDTSYFERFYTKLIRFVSQGRLLRDSSRGVLIVDKERAVRGETVTIRAALSDSQFQPLMVPNVKATLVSPAGQRRDLILQPVEKSGREGLFSAEFPALLEGNYTVQLLIPDSNDEILTREVRVTVPKLEIEKPQRNDALLSELAKMSNGVYYVGLASTQGNEIVSKLSDEIISKDQETYLPGTSDDDFQQRLMWWLLALICGALSLEWLIRRLSKLA